MTVVFGSCATWFVALGSSPRLRFNQTHAGRPASLTVVTESFYALRIPGKERAMPRTRRSQSIQVLVVLTLACLLPAPAAAHPGSGIVVDRFGQIYFVDMVSGVWKLDTHGALTHRPGPAFHWMTLDATDRFADT